ncbi:MAG: NADP-dependent isocitrate dehydrogenase [bacterium]|nr:NADP-dependent isocitrate dehydrogenase [bacterium]MDT8367477.1 NADP-dependent isocitrate dehydrogenase [bacterium]
MTTKTPKISWTLTDEAPMLATFSLLPIIRAFAKESGIEVELRDISVAGRIIANFPENLTEDQKIPDELTALGKLALTKDANIVKLPNISASIPQLTAAIKELQEQGYNVPDYPEEPKNEAERKIQERYAVVLGSAVNPVLRQGNSDRRLAEAVKQATRRHPHRMHEWKPDSKTHVSTMKSGDFYSNEKSTTMSGDTTAKIEFVDDKGKVKVLKEGLPLKAGEVVDATFMSKKALVKFFEEQIEDAKKRDVLFSLHLKATMMKISDPIIFGHCVKVFYREVLEKHAKALEEIGFDPNNGIGDLYARLDKLPESKRGEIEADIQAVYVKRPRLAMVDSDRGITNLHVPSDIIIDASMPPMIRDGGKMWGPDGKPYDAKASIPDHSYAGLYQEAIENCRKHGALDPSTIGSVPNVGLMAQKAEEYGSHDKTFQAPGKGTMRIVDAAGRTILESQVEEGDVWRAPTVKDEAIRDWVKLAVTRARATGWPAVFWLDKNRPHDAQLIKKVDLYLKDHDTKGLEFYTMGVAEATRFSFERMREGKNTISVTGNILRDYNTDLFPILEANTSAKMLSVVPLLNGGGLFETGAGGSAPKHVQQFVKEGYLRWDSIGELLALAESLRHLGEVMNNEKAIELAQSVEAANAKWLENNRTPARKLGEIDNRGGHFYFALYWAQAVAKQAKNTKLQARFAKLAKELEANEEKINAEFIGAQGDPQDIGGYYHPDLEKAEKAMRPSATFNSILDGFAAGN